jgi:hypothetical protein
VLLAEVKRARRCFDALAAMIASDPCFLSVAEAAAMIKIGCAARLCARRRGQRAHARGEPRVTHVPRAR